MSPEKRAISEFGSTFELRRREHEGQQCGNAMIGIERLRKIEQNKPIQRAEYLGSSRKAHMIPKRGQTDMIQRFGPALILR
jgi:hypothetical protein